jgi:hypothetical protein
MTAGMFKRSVVSRDNCQPPIATTAHRSSADRIRLLGTLDDLAPITLCTTGTFTAVRQQGTWAQVDMAWTASFCGTDGPRRNNLIATTA